MIKLNCVDLKTFVKKEGLSSKIKRADKAILDEFKNTAENSESSTVKKLERKLNLMVYRLYHLSLDDAHIVDPDLECTEAEYVAVFA